jgi:hypothetical protein
MFYYLLDRPLSALAVGLALYLVLKGLGFAIKSWRAF